MKVCVPSGCVLSDFSLTCVEPSTSTTAARYDHTSARNGETWRDHWRTPPEFVRSVELATGATVVLDVAATAHNKVADLHLGPGGVFGDALTRNGQQWAEIAQRHWAFFTDKEIAVWCNPPYSQLDGGGWVERFVECGQHVTTVVLVPARLETRWAQALCEGASDVLWSRGRVSFLVPHDAPPEASAGRPPGATVVVVRRPGHTGPTVHRYIERGVSAQGVLV